MFFDVTHLRIVHMPWKSLKIYDFKTLTQKPTLVGSTLAQMNNS